jgi:hypothetical protein
MMRALGLFALLVAVPVAVPLAACGSDSPDPSVSGVFPASAFTGRKVRVEVSGDVTGWSSGATVNFGDGVTVDTVTVASPSALFADITIANDATLGARDVTVTDGGESLVLTAAFELDAAVDIQFNGTVAQGSVATFTVANHDLSTLFDTTAEGGDIFTPPTFTHVQFTSPAGVRLSVGSVTEFAITGTAFFDVDAASGPVAVHSGPDGDQTVSSSGELTVTPRTATALTSGTPAAGNVGAPFETSLFEFTPGTAPSITTMAALSSDPNATPGFALLPASGKFDDLLSFGASAAQIQETGSDKFYLVYFDNSGFSGYPFSLRATSATAAATAAEAEPNETEAQAKLATALPFLLTTATLSSVDDVDFVSLDVVAGQIGKRIHVLTAGGDPQTDTVVEVFGPAATGSGTVSLGGPSADTNFHEDLVSAPITKAGKHFVKVTASQGFFLDAHKAYVLAVFVE